jgi:hypothetical protein
MRRLLPPPRIRSTRREDDDGYDDSDLRASPIASIPTAAFEPRGAERERVARDAMRPELTDEEAVEERMQAARDMNATIHQHSRRRLDMTQRTELARADVRPSGTSARARKAVQDQARSAARVKPRKHLPSNALGGRETAGAASVGRRVHTRDYVLATAHEHGHNDMDDHNLMQQIQVQPGRAKHMHASSRDDEERRGARFVSMEGGGDEDVLAQVTERRSQKQSSRPVRLSAQGVPLDMLPSEDEEEDRGPLQMIKSRPPSKHHRAVGEGDILDVRDEDLDDGYVMPKQQNRGESDRRRVDVRMGHIATQEEEEDAQAMPQHNRRRRGDRSADAQAEIAAIAESIRNTKPLIQYQEQEEDHHVLHPQNTSRRRPKSAAGAFQLQPAMKHEDGEEEEWDDARFTAQSAAPRARNKHRHKVMELSGTAGNEGEDDHMEVAQGARHTSSSIQPRRERSPLQLQHEPEEKEEEDEAPRPQRAIAQRSRRVHHGDGVPAPLREEEEEAPAATHHSSISSMNLKIKSSMRRPLLPTVHMWDASDSEEEDMRGLTTTRQRRSFAKKRSQGTRVRFMVEGLEEDEDSVPDMALHQRGRATLPTTPRSPSMAMALDEFKDEEDEEERHRQDEAASRRPHMRLPPPGTAQHTRADDDSLVMDGDDRAPTWNIAKPQDADIVPTRDESAVSFWMGGDEGRSTDKAAMRVHAHDTAPLAIGTKDVPARASQREEMERLRAQNAPMEDGEDGRIVVSGRDTPTVDVRERERDMRDVQSQRHDASERKRRSKKRKRRGKRRHRDRGLSDTEDEG